MSAGYPILSVAICTRNRDMSLRRTLNTLVETTRTIDWSWELLLIDNASFDDTYKVAQEFERKLLLRYIFESQVGHSYARNRAIAEAKSEFIVFTDDDVNISAGWLESYADVLLRYPKAVFIGGKILPAWDTTPPRWVIHYASSWLNGVIVWYDGGNKEWIFDKTKDPFYGANFGCRVDILKKIGGFDVNLGHRDNEQLGADEMQVMDALCREGYLGVYTPDSIIYHRIDPNRWSKRYIFKRSLAHGRVCIIRQSLFSNEEKKFYYLKLILRIAASISFYVLGELCFCPPIWLRGLCRLGWAVGEWQELRIKQRVSFYK